MMAVGPILTVLSNIPWGAVVDNAPKVADGAAKLWNTVSRWNKPDPIKIDSTDSDSRPSGTEADLISPRLQAVEANVRQLNEQMQLSSALIKDLAEQNATLVQRLELNRLRLVKVLAAVAFVGIVLFGVIAYLIFAE